MYTTLHYTTQQDTYAGMGADDRNAEEVNVCNLRSDNIWAGKKSTFLCVCGVMMNLRAEEFWPCVRLEATAVLRGWCSKVTNIWLF